uniref:Galectin n=1 Tax=Panagrellus redivivus TaxID=6233 RepID=A0A7E4ZYU4_PANRE
MNRTLLLVFTYLSIGLLVNAWLPVGDDFRYEDDHSAPIIPKRTFAHDHVFHYVFSHELNFSQTLHFSGIPELKISDEFEFNIISSSDVNSDDAVRILHIKYLHSGALIYNTFNNDWGDEERTDPSPIKQGKPFTMQIRVALEAFEISVNGIHVHTYKHRLPPNITCFIRILGGVTLTRARVAGQQFEVPYKVMLPNSGLELVDHVNFVATASKGEFTINFLNVSENIVMQFNMRIGDKGIDYNIFKHGKLYSSQRGKGVFIAEGREFELNFMILPDRSGVAVHIDGVFYQTFKHDMQAASSKDEFYYFQVTGNVDFRALEVCPHEYVKGWKKSIQHAAKKIK